MMVNIIVDKCKQIVLFKEKKKKKRNAERELIELLNE